MTFSREAFLDFLKATCANAPPLTLPFDVSDAQSLPALDVNEARYDSVDLPGPSLNHIESN